MSMIYTITNAEWENLVLRMHGEGVDRLSLSKHAEGGIGMSGTVQDMILWLSHVAEVIEPHTVTSEMQNLRYLTDQVQSIDGVWCLPCVRMAEGGV